MNIFCIRGIAHDSGYLSGPLQSVMYNGPLARYVKLRVLHAPGMLWTFSPLSRVSDSDMRHGMCVTHVPWRMPGSLAGGFLRSRWRGKRFRHSRRMHNPQFYVSGKRPTPMSQTRKSNTMYRVPQGFIFLPLPFLIYINDLFSVARLAMPIFLLTTPILSLVIIIWTILWVK